MMEPLLPFERFDHYGSGPEGSRPPFGAFGPHRTPLTRRLMNPCSRPLRFVAILGGAFALPAAGVSQTSAVLVELESGLAWQSYNDVEIPNDGTATRFSLSELAGSGPWSAGRLTLTWNRNERHGLTLLLAPFSLTEEGVPAEPLRFAGANYLEGVPASATYRFNSYRLSYRYRWRETERTTARVGLTAKVRDARIALAQEDTSSRKDDLGFVPLLHLSGEWRVTPEWQFSAELDALAGGPGRAADLSVKLGRNLSERWSVHGGYRMVEGGADVSEVYAFAWLHYAVLALSWAPFSP